MLDAIIIFTKGGVIVWSYSFLGNAQMPWRDALDSLIKTVFLEEKLSGNTLSETQIENTRASWLLVNPVQSVVAALYTGGTDVGYVRQVLKGVEKEFTRVVNELLPGASTTTTARGDANETTTQTTLWHAFQTGDTSSRFTQRFLHLVESCDARWERGIHTPQELRSNQKNERGHARQTEGKPKKKPTTWGTRKVTKQAMSALDFSEEQQPETSAAVLLSDPDSSLSSLESDASDVSDEEETTADAVAPETQSQNFFSRLKTSVQQSLTGNKVLTSEDLTDLLNDLKTLLLEKNVASDMVDQLIRSLQVSLVGTRTSSFQSVKAAVRTALHDALERVLAQHSSIDVLKAAYAARDQSRVYSVCFLGVNGVGKSTSLAKLAYYLKHKGKLRVMFAACDTFRAGAVEQLKTHARHLGVHVYEQGYGKDAAVLCKNALKYAQAEGYDVVLIDTAGRMQDNEPLMRALAKLVALNNPDLVLFVGEALVGNDATDQLIKFHRSLIDFAPTTVERPRGIDGIILTKFDTVDTKVGAALSMAYASGSPVVFVGTGQKYTHLQTLRVKAVVQAILDG